jgi:hypothetical protein
LQPTEHDVDWAGQRELGNQKQPVGLIPDENGIIPDKNGIPQIQTENSHPVSVPGPGPDESCPFFGPVSVFPGKNENGRKKQNTVADGTRFIPSVFILNDKYRVANASSIQRCQIGTEEYVAGRVGCAVPQERPKPCADALPSLVVATAQA